MSVADKLGTGSSFERVPRNGRRSDRGRAKAVAQGDIPEYELVRLPLTAVAPTPLNPRRNFGTDEEKTRFGEELRTAQLAACVAVTRSAYLALWPDHEPRIGAADWVLVNGERRFRSGVHVGLEALDFVVRDDLASSREEFVSNLLKENFDREDFDVIERARGVQEMVSVCGGDSARGARSRAATRLSRDRSWVTNQLALLSLPDEVQAMLSSGEVSERDGRLLARHYKEHPQLDAADLLAHLKQTRAEEAREREEERSLLQAVKQRKPTTLLSADNKQASAQRSPSPGPDTQSLLSADNKQPGRDAGTAPGEPTSTVLLCADNNTDSPAARVPSQSTSADTTPADAAVDNDEYPSAQPEACALVDQLGATSAERAQKLAEGMTPEELKSLVEELRAYL
jgi:ParB family chromosome partitioning protein